jgi:class 3 adenylate cyclase/tRNA A-37 threonylcarbamoyl transferase component Bud32
VGDRPKRTDTRPDLGGGGAERRTEPYGAGARRERRAERLAPGAIVDDRYRIEALLGEGGMGSVYVARHVHIGRQVALKILHPERYETQADREKFRREAAVAVQLRSPHVVEVLDFGEDPRGHVYYAMELLEGESLRALLERERRLAPERTVRLLRQLLTGLKAAHAAGVVHRDLKPENLWLVGRGSDAQLKILDFGIAKFMQPGASLDSTAIGMVVGTPEYLAPEQAIGAPVDGRADLYATGILAFVLLTGRHPFDTTDVKTLSRAHAFQKVPSPTTVLPELAAWPRLVKFCARATQKDPDARPQSAEEALDLLEGAEHAEHLATATGERAAARTSVTGGAVLVGKSPAANLTVLLARIDRWDELAPASEVERAAILADHDAVALPVIGVFEGRRLRSADDALLLAFTSPTDAVHCAAALHDRFAQHPVPCGGAPIALRIGIHQAEIRFDGGELSGAPMAALGAVEEAAAPGEVWLSRPVYLTMSRSEVAVEAMGAAPLEGLPEPTALYRVVRGGGALPYGGDHLSRVDSGSRLMRGVLAPFASGLASIETAGSNEGRGRAAFRVTAAGLSVLALGALWTAAWIGEAIVLAISWVGWAKRPVPRSLARPREGLAWTRARLGERMTLVRLHMRRPGRVVRRPAGPAAPPAGPGEAGPGEAGDPGTPADDGREA